MGKIKVALAGVGNCASALIQGIQYYRKNPPTENGLTTGLMHPSFGPYKVEDITFVAAFEVNKKKIGADLSKAIFTEPNTAPRISDVPDMDVTRSEEHTSELQSLTNLVCRLLLEKKKKTNISTAAVTVAVISLQTLIRHQYQRKISTAPVPAPIPNIICHPSEIDTS